MDITCGKCGEPWEVYWINHHVDEEYANDPDAPDNPGDHIKHGRGCPVCEWGKNTNVSRGRSESEDELQAERMRDLMNNTDEDPTKYF